MLEPEFFTRKVVDVARALIGVRFRVNGVGGVIVEVEAYDRQDPASHAYKGRTRRNASMFGPPGHAYVYWVYGMHWSVNFVCGGDGGGSGVLIRALEPLDGLDLMRERRGMDDPRLLCSGPGRLCQALAITRAYDGLPLDQPPFELEAGAAGIRVVTGPRIGLSKAVETPWRFAAAGSRFLSKPLREMEGPER